MNTDDRTDDAHSSVVVAIAVLGGALSVVNGPSPTGQTITDIVLVALGVAATIWFASVVPVRFASILALLAGCTSATWPGLALGVIAYVGAAGSSAARPSPPWLSAALLALTLNLGVRSDLSWFFGDSSVIGIAIAVIAVARALPLRPSRHRRRLGAAVGLAGLVVVLAGAGLASAGLDSRDDLRDGERIVQRGLDELIDGDVETATASFADANVAFGRAHDRLSSPLTALAAVVPVLSQHREAGVELADQARSATQTLSAELGPIDIDELSFSQGRIDIAAISELAEPLAVVRRDIDRLRSTVVELNVPWLVSPVRDRLVRLDSEIAEQLDRSELFVDVVEHAPDLLGRDGPRRYFVAFTTPSEVRGLGGFMGNWAEVTIDDGAIELTRFGRTNDLDDGSIPGDREVDGPADWLSRYGPFGFTNGPGGGTNVDPWKNITMSASMESTGEVIADLYPQSGGRPVDGVFALDVFAVAALLELTGPIELPDGEGELTADNAARFFLKEQYDDLGEKFSIAENENRIDSLEVVSNEAFERLLETDLPPATEILDLLAPLVERGSIAGYAVDAAEQQLLRDASLSGTLPIPDGGDALAVTFNNAIGNKIDFFLSTSAVYEVTADPETSRIDAVLDIEMANGSPGSGQPSYVIGNPLGRPFGSNRTLVSVYSQLPATGATIDGVEVVSERTSEAGYFVTGILVDLAPGENALVRLDFSGTLDLDDGYDLSVRVPPLAKPMDLVVDASLTSSDAVLTERVEVRRPGVHDLVVEPSPDS